MKCASWFYLVHQRVSSPLLLHQRQAAMLHLLRFPARVLDIFLA